MTAAPWGRESAGQKAWQADPLTPDVTDLWADGYNAATEALNAVPGPLIAQYLPLLATVQPDRDDNPQRHAGFCAALHEAGGAK